MTEQSLGQTAASILTRAMTQEGPPSGLAGDLLRLVSEQLGASEIGRQALARLQAEPSEQRANVVSALVDEEATTDPAFAQRLHTTITSVPITQGAASTVTQGLQANPTRQGLGSTSQSVGWAGGNVTQIGKSRKTLLGVGVACLATITIGGTVAYNTFGPGRSATSSSSDPSTMSVSAIGAEPGQTGARQTWEAFTDAWSKRDFTRMCALYTPEALQTIAQDAGSCEAYYAQAGQSSDSAILAEDGHKIVVQDVQVVGHEAQITLVREGNPADPAPVYMRRFVDRWRLTTDDLSQDFTTGS